MSKELVAAVGKRMIQRKDVKARQLADGSYFPVRDRRTNANIPFALSDLLAHFAGTETYGHYLLDQDDNCKFFCFDIDLKKDGFWCIPPNHAEPVWTDGDDGAFINAHVTYEFNPRESWRDRAHPSRAWVKAQLAELAHTFASAVTKTLDIPVAAAYTGNKGIHVYGFTGVVKAEDAREGARIVLETMDSWEPSRGKAFWSAKDQNPVTGYPNFSLEVFPKQDSLEGKDLGNLLRLPLGRNLKAPNDPTFFIDLVTPVTVLAPHKDPVTLLESGDAWSS